MINDAPLDIEQEWPRPYHRAAALKHLAQQVTAEELDEKAAQLVWDMFLAPLYDVMAARAVYTRMLSCRSCGRPHPASPRGQRSIAKKLPVPPHARHCPHYVGPLDHRAVKVEKGLIGWRLLCSCGQTYPDEPNTVCPNADVDWRGPRP